VGDAVGNAVGDAVGDAAGEALGDVADGGVLVVGGTVRSKVVSALLPSEGVSGRSSSSAERAVESTSAPIHAPTSTIGARTAVRGKSTHGESPTCVRPSRR
jgi:hypothetical protein